MFRGMFLNTVVWAADRILHTLHAFVWKSDGPQFGALCNFRNSWWQEIKAVQLEDSLIEGEGEMDVSDSEEEPQRKKARNQLDGNQEDVERLQSLKEENDSLRCQLEAYKNEVRANASRFRVEATLESFSKRF